MKKRDISVEFVRIIAILMVIGNHTASWYLSGDTVLRGNLMIYGFFQDAVPLFWYTTGMFLFRQHYLQLYAISAYEILLRNRNKERGF